MASPARPSRRTRVVPPSADVPAETRSRVERLATRLPSAGKSAASSAPSGQQRRAAVRPHRLFTLRLIREGSFPAPDGHPERGIPIRSPRDVAQIMAPYAAREAVESFWILALDAQHRVIGGAPTVITRGLLNWTPVHAREVFCAAILAFATAIILCHNHPTGSPTPSVADKEITEQLVEAGKLLDIPVHDHVIIARGGYTSFAETGLIG